MNKRYALLIFSIMSSALPKKFTHAQCLLAVVLDENVCLLKLVRILNDNLFFSVILVIGNYWAVASMAAKTVNTGYIFAFNLEFFLKNVTIRASDVHLPPSSPSKASLTTLFLKEASLSLLSSKMP